MVNQFNLSPSTLGLFKECPRCFWLHIDRNHKRPRGIFPSLPGGMDLVIKKYFDKYRGSLPPEIKGKVRGVLFDDLITLNKWRYWRTSLKYQKDNITLHGAFDDLLIEDDIFIPLDYKTRGSEPKEETLEYFLHQLDLYTLLLARNGYKTDGLAYLVYYYPQKVSENGMVKFKVEPEEVKVSLKRAEKLLDDAIDLLKGPEPKSHKECEYCNFVKFFAEFD